MNELHADDDQHWLDLMAGREVADARPRTRTDAAWLRAALLAYRSEPPPGDVPEAQARVQRLLQRAREAALLPSSPVSGPLPAAKPAPVRPRWWRRRGQPSARPGAQRPAWPLWGGGAVAAVLVAGVGLQWPPAPNGPEEAVPSGPPGGVLRAPSPLHRITDPDPPARQQALLRALREAGIDVHPFERLGRAGLDLELAVPLPAAQARVLASLGLPAPAGPQLLVEILPVPPAAASAVAR